MATSNRKAKKLARARQRSTGERYTEALASVRSQVSLETATMTENDRLKAENETLKTQIQILTNLSDLQDGTSRGKAPRPKKAPGSYFRYGEIALYSTAFFDKDEVLDHRNEQLFRWSLGMRDQGGHAHKMADTNLKEGGRIPSGQLYDAHGVVVELLDGSEEDARSVRECSKLAWDFLQTSVDIAPLGAFSWDRVGRKGLFWYGLHPVRLPGSTTFGVLLQLGRVSRDETKNYAVTGSNFRVRVSLLGAYNTAIELG